MGGKKTIFRTCQNLSCSLYKKRWKRNIIKFGKQKNGAIRYKCNSCHKTFSETRNTFRFYKHLKKDEIIQICRMLSKKMSFRKISRNTNRHLDTIRNFASSIQKNYSLLKNYFSKDLKLTNEETDSMLKFINKKKKNPSE